MKKIALFLVLITSLISCSLDDNRDTYTYKILAVESYEVPESFKIGETYEIKLKYQRPNPCYIFQGIFYEKNLNIRTIAIQTAIKDDQVCTQQLPPLSETSFNFYVTNNDQGSYIFKFYKGKNDNNENIFEEVEIPIVQ
jgi:hypothetical protein